VHWIRAPWAGRLPPSGKCGDSSEEKKELHWNRKVDPSPVSSKVVAVHSCERTTHHILMWIQVYFESVGFAPLQNSYTVVHKFVVVFSTRHRIKTRQQNEMSRGTHGPACSSASHVTGNRSKLKPQPLSLVRCTSAEPSSRFSGCPRKLSSPASALSQKSSRIYEGRSTGAFDDPERLTPRKRRVRPALSTKLHDVVWMKESPVGFPVVGDDEGTFGIL